MAKKKSTDFFDSPIWDFIEMAGKNIGINLLFVAACIPIVTIGPACCGLFSAIRYYVRKDSMFEGFKKGFTTNIWRMMIIWIIGAVITLYFGLIIFDIAKHFKTEYLVDLIFPSLICAVCISFLTATVVYNVYFPRKMIDLLTESAAFVFRAPLQVFISGILFCAPIVAFGPFFDYLFDPLIIVVVIAIYFVLVALGATILLKNPLIKVLNEKRASGEFPPLRKDEEEEL